MASFVQRHFGEAMVENIADPLLAGVYGGDSAALSVRSVLPRFWEMERQHGSLTRATLKAMRQRRAAPQVNNGSGREFSRNGYCPAAQAAALHDAQGRASTNDGEARGPG